MNNLIDRETLMIVGGALALLLVLGTLSAWTEPVDGTDNETLGIWYQVRNPPGMSDRYECWVWQRGLGDSRSGGTVCFEAR